MDSRIFFLPFVIFTTIAVSAWWYIRTTDFLLIIVAIIALNICLSWWLNRPRKDWWNFALLPTLLWSSALSYALVLSDSQLVAVVIIVSGLGVIFYWRQVFLYIFRQTAYRPFSLERLSAYLAFLTIFFSVGAAYGVRTFLDISSFQLSTVIFLFIAGVIYQWAWVQKLSFENSWRYCLAFAFILVEFFYVLGFLPIHFNILGFLLASSWYTMSSLASYDLTGHLTVARARLVLSILAFSWLIVLVTARWF